MAHAAKLSWLTGRTGGRRRSGNVGGVVANAVGKLSVRCVLYVVLR